MPNLLQDFVFASLPPGLPPMFVDASQQSIDSLIYLQRYTAQQIRAHCLRDMYLLDMKRMSSCI